MTPNTNTRHAVSATHGFLTGHRLAPMPRDRATSRRISPVLSAQELRQLVSQMVD